MKSSVADRSTRVLCLRIVAVGGTTVRLTDHPVDLSMGATIYKSTAGYEFSGYSSSAGFSPSAIDLEGIADAAGITRAQIASGLFDGARAYGFATDWTSPAEDEEPLVALLFGRAELLDGRYRISGVSIADALGQTVGLTYGPACSHTFGDSGCGANLATYTINGTLTSVSSATTFRDSALAYAADTFGAGTFKFTSGANAGLRATEIKSFAADGTFTLWEPAYYTPSVGDAYTAVRGCRKRLVDCQGFGLVLNFFGFPDVPVTSSYARFGTGGS